MSIRILATIFALAMIYASFCSTGCVFGVCPYQQQESTNYEFGHHSSNPLGVHHHDHEPKKSDCSTHHHPTFNVSAGDSAYFQLSSTGQMPINDRLDTISVGRQMAFRSSLFSDVGSPPIFENSLYQGISVLRI